MIGSFDIFIITIFPKSTILVEIISNLNHNKEYYTTISIRHKYNSLSNYNSKWFYLSLPINSSTLRAIMESQDIFFTLYNPPYIINLLSIYFIAIMKENTLTLKFSRNE